MKNYRLTSIGSILVMIAVLMLNATTGSAQEVATFMGSVNTLWSNPANWADGHKPTTEDLYVNIAADVVVDEDATIQNLHDASTCNLTLQEGRILTVKEAIVWNKGGDFTLEDGAQLITDSQVFATAKKKIAAYDEEAMPWHVIASPVMEALTPSIENGFLTEPETGYALIAFDEATLGWIDFKQTAFPIANGKGYFYTNALDTTLLFTGTLNGGSTAEVSLDYHLTNGKPSGWNLVGNPLPCETYSDRSYYIVNKEVTRFIPTAMSSLSSIPPCSGLFAQAADQDDKMVFSRSSTAQPIHNKGYIALSVAKSNAASNILDKAIVSFNAGDDLEKLFYNSDFPRVFFTLGNKDLSIISIDSTNMLPLKFKTEENGSYLFSFELDNTDIHYLHLIDNMTGNNIDLLTSPNYTFTATANDYISRFKLVFDPHYGVEEYDPSTGSGAFAYYADGVIYINNVETQDFASLQIVDLTGRVVVSHCGRTRCVPTAGMAPGVYVLRLNDGNSIRTQKIVIQ